ncbi:methyl-accepting chemotaxis protein [Hyphomicrobiales bacterium BP6-180914]|uniref:Methyl-accepting chemotaxis protein n=2 Tax=Lichenifustis flavocetrariae TaxID=2949735 RepID=A0AA41Z3S7_9HYPH|nr:methyl-accepting chemotaxis protein [Lichenifustis flavocetrariae]
MMWDNLKISKKLGLAFALQIAGTLVLSAVLFFVLISLRQAAQWNDHTYEVLAKIEGVITSMVNQETGLRGYLIGGKDSFLEPYNAGEAAGDQAMDQLQSLTADNPAQQTRIADLRRLVAQWRDEAAKPSIKLMTDVATQDQARTREASGFGKQSMDAIRAKAAEISGAEAALLVERGRLADQMHSVAQWALLIGGLASIALATLMGVIFSRSVTMPIARLTRAMDRITQGEADAIIERTERTDEVGDLTRTASAFGEAAHKLRAEAQASVGREVLERERQEREAAQARDAADDLHIITELGTGLRALSDGNLTHRIESAFAAKATQLKEDFNSAVGKLQETMTVISGSSSAIRLGTAEISTASDDLSRRTEQQAASLEETAAALDEITATVKKTSDGSRHAQKVVGSAKSDAERSGIVVSQAVEAMSAIEQSAHKISQIIGVIDEIAFQTNLLALNAGVEAARAGEAGRGFAVVASEVRALAQRSAEAAKEIKALISTSSQQVEAGVDLVNETGGALKRIVTQVAEINAVVSDIATSTQEQATALQEVNTAINQMDQVTQQNAAMVEESTAASKNLAQETEELARLIGQFQIETNQRPIAARLQARPARKTVTALKTTGTGGATRKPEAAAQSWEEF